MPLWLGAWHGARRPGFVQIRVCKDAGLRPALFILLLCDCIYSHASRLKAVGVLHHSKVTEDSKSFLLSGVLEFLTRSVVVTKKKNTTIYKSKNDGALL